MAHKCPINGCKVEVPDWCPLCSEHWFMVPVTLRNKIRRLGRMGQARHEELEERCREAAEHVSGLLDGSIIDVTRS